MDEINRGGKGEIILKKSFLEKWGVPILTLILIFLMIYQIWGVDIENYLKKPEYSVDLIDGGRFNESLGPLFSDPHTSISHDINIKTTKEKAIINFLIKNEGPNFLDDYELKVKIIDPFKNIRGEKEIVLNKEAKKLNVIFNFPAENEKLYDDWKVYSKIEKAENVYSVSLFSFKPSWEVVPWWEYLLYGFIIIISLITMILFKKRSWRKRK